MRLTHLALVVSLALAACGGGGSSNGGLPDGGGNGPVDAGSGRDIDAGAEIDAGRLIDAAVPIDAARQLDAAVPIDAARQLDAAVPIDAPTQPLPDGIAAVIAATDNTAITLPVNATVTYLKPEVPGETTDPAGFTVQGSKTGPAIFVAVDPATLTPPAQVGDVVSFMATQKTTVSRQPRVLSITSYTRSKTGTDVGLLTQDLSSATDVVANLDHYDSQLVTITGSLVGALSNGGAGFQRAPINTAGITGNTNYQLRMPSTVIDSIDLMQPCKFTVSRVPMGQFNTQAQIAAFRASDIQLSACPLPDIVSLEATSATTIVITTTRNIKPSSITNPTVQFKVNGTVTVMAAIASGRTITLTVLGQVGGTAYTLTTAPSVTDFAGGALPSTSSFTGYGTPSNTGALLSVHTTLGIPGPLSTTAPSDNFQSVKAQYVVSYNGSRRTPNWVSWELNASYFGSGTRQDTYRSDDTFPGNEPQAQNSDYLSSGYDRGHMCPSADRTLSNADNDKTFYLTNMVPQAPNNNQGPWNDLEAYTRDQLTGGKEIFVISGPIYSASSGTTGVGSNTVYVPDSTWKVIVILDSAVNPSPAMVTTSTRVISVIMPNNNALINKGDPWRNYRVSVDQIEAKTGLNIMSDVSPSVQAVIEARVDNL